MTTRTETAPVAGQCRHTATRPTLAALLADWFPERYWRGVGTVIRIAVAVLLLVLAASQR